VRVAVGLERHDNEFSQRLDANNVLASGAVTTKNILNRRHNTSFFGEVFVPVVSEEQSIPGVHSLSVSVAGRREEYSDFGSTTDPKIGVIWRPISSLTARATYGTSFRAPSLVDTSDPQHLYSEPDRSGRHRRYHSRHLSQRRPRFIAA
jgi:iron complex outermembrane receptor protein